MRRWLLVLPLVMLTSCQSVSPSVDKLAGEMRSQDVGSGVATVPAADRYVSAFRDLVAHCSNSPSDVERSINTDAGFLTINGYPGGASDWAFMRTLRVYVGIRTGADCSRKAADLVAASGVNVP